MSDASIHPPRYVTIFRENPFDWTSTSRNRRTRHKRPSTTSRLVVLRSTIPARSVAPSTSYRVKEQDT